MNHATVRVQYGMAQFVEQCAAHGYAGVSVWGAEVEKVGFATARSMIADHGLFVFGYNRAGPLMGPDFHRKDEAMDAARREIDRAAEIGADHVMLFPGGFVSGEKDLSGARQRFAEMAKVLLDHAKTAGIRLALEPLHPMLVGDRTCMGTLRHANDLCDRLGEGTGIVVDAHHVWWDEALEPEIARAGAADRILAFHVNDWLLPTRHRLTDRGMMGDGIIDLKGMWRSILGAGYDGPLEVEIFSEDWWAEPGDRVLEIAMQRCREIFDGDTDA
ncbi:sugar phosphate isomerase/epimerase family protein [Nitratireductor sp. GISD-1A_MAKvit]|uniref:sugar phosphate isomerase/epimerase family protein n=1 Tax=Nitratireductor sp. GISD-1A_MAKvit TaxID=3234198 RepID=UPI003465DDED